MGYFDGLTDASFKKGLDGQVIFYPWGKLGHGYEIPNDETYHTIRGFVKRYLVVALPLVILIGSLFGWLYSFLTILPLYVFYALRIRQFTRELIRSSERLTFAESYRNQARSHHLATLCFLLVCSVLFVIGGVAMLFVGFQGPLIPIASILFFGSCSIAIGFMVREKWKR